MKRVILMLVLASFAFQVVLPGIVAAQSPASGAALGRGGPADALPTLNPADRAAAEAALREARDPEAWQCWTTSSILFGAGSVPVLRISCAVAWVMFQFMSGVSLLMGTMGVVLNFAVLYLVTGMGQFVLEMGIGNPWTVLRDITNVFLVFLTLFIGIATILGISSYGYKALLWRVILAALLVNFSLLFTQIVIDTSNLAAHTIYKQMTTIDAGGACTTSSQLGNLANADNPCLKYGIAGGFMQRMGLVKLFSKINERGASTDTAVADAQKDSAYYKIALASFMGTIMFLVGAFVFGAAAFLLITRFVILVFLMILSAPAFVLFMLGRGGGKKWWSTLIRESFFAPAFFLMIWISLVMLDRIIDFMGIRNGGAQSAVETGNIASIQLIFSFLIVCGFLIASLIIARMMGAHGAAGAVSLGQRWARGAGMAVGAGVGGATAGVAAFGGRRFLGAGARLAADSETLKNGEYKGKSMATRFVARTLRSGLQGAASSSFDARKASKAAQKYLGQAGGKGGYDAWAEQKAKKMAAKDKEAKEYRGSSEERRTKDVEMEDVNEAYEATKRLNVEQDLDTNTKALDKSIQTLTQTIEDETKKGASAEYLGELRKELGAQQQTRADFQARKDTMVKRGELQKRVANKSLGEQERAAAQTELDETTRAVRRDYAYHDPKLAELQKSQEALRKKLAQTQSKGEKDVIEKEIARMEQRYNKIADYHDMRTNLKQGNPGITDREIEAHLERARIQERSDIDAQHTAAWKAKGEARAATYLDRESTRGTLGMPPADWRRRAVAQVRATQGKSKEELAIRDLLDSIKKEEVSAPTSAGSQSSQTSAGQPKSS